MGKIEIINWVVFCVFIKYILYVVKWRVVNCFLLSVFGLSFFFNKNFINVLFFIKYDKINN